MEILVDSATPVNSGLCAKYKRSFAFPTVTERLPVILTGIIDHLKDEKKEESKSVIGGLSELKYTMQTAKTLQKFISDEPDTDSWNRDLTQIEQKVDGEVTFYSGPWLFVECYLYRRIREIFAISSSLKQYDPFGDKKKSLLHSSLPAVQHLFDNLVEGKILDIEPIKTTDMIQHFILLMKYCLWANRVDLSMTSGDTENCHMSLKLDDWDSFILVNQIEDILNYMFSPHVSHDKKKIVDYVVDNSGLELLCDLCLADLLVTRCGVDLVRLRLKRISWFVSDATPADLTQTLKFCSSQPQEHSTKLLAGRWQGFIDKGVWSVHEDDFWTLGLPYDQMIEKSPDLYSTLSDSHIVILKGDLNYRKLVQDTSWEPATPLSQAVGRFRPAPLVAIRTLKADTVAGLPSGIAERLDKEDSNWMCTGQYGIIQFLSLDSQ